MNILAVAGTLPSDQERMLDVVNRQSERLGRLIDDLLEVSRAGTRWQIDVEDVDLAALARSVAERFAFDATRASSELAVRADAAVIGRWDRSQLDQMVTNLLTNALKVGAGKPIEIAVDAEDEWARLVVRDHGIGIPIELHARIFDAFQRGVSARHYGGLGIGLYVVRRIVERHQGSIRVESQPGMGATFVVRLPRETSQ